MNAYRLTYVGDFCFVYSNHMLFQSSYYFNSVFRVMILCGRSIGFVVPTIQTMRAESPPLHTLGDVPGLCCCDDPCAQQLLAIQSNLHGRQSSSLDQTPLESV